MTSNIHFVPQHYCSFVVVAVDSLMNLRILLTIWHYCLVATTATELLRSPSLQFLQQTFFNVITLLIFSVALTHYVTHKEMSKYDSALIAGIRCSWIVMVVAMLYYHSTTDDSSTELMTQIPALTATTDTINPLSGNRPLSTDFKWPSTLLFKRYHGIND